MENKKPRVSIGLPVYNGENFLEDALVSVLKQTYTDFELIISDNASTDRTPEIIQRYAARDGRIRHTCNETNIGAHGNWNRVFQLSGGEYFFWVAHDDTYDPRFLEKCVESLDRDPSVVLCYARTNKIDKDGKVVGQFQDKVRGESPKPHIRFRNLIMNVKCFEIFGVFRSEAIRKTPVFGGYGHADGVLLARLGLLGRFHEIPEYLYFNRDHESKSLYAYSTYRDYAVWYEPANAGKILLPRWRHGLEYLKCVASSPLGWKERWLCYLQMGYWVKGYWKSLGANLVIAGWQVLCLPVQKIRVKYFRQSHIQEKAA